MTQTPFHPLNDRISVAPQILIEDVARAKDEGFTLIVNNRPDGEEPDAPQGPQIEAAAKAAGLSYIAIPVTHAGFSAPQIDALKKAMADLGEDGRVLAYCRSGTRSTLLWALTSASAGVNPATIAEAASAQGYDISPVRLAVDSLAAQAR